MVKDVNFDNLQSIERAHDHQSLKMSKLTSKLQSIHVSSQQEKFVASVNYIGISHQSYVQKRRGTGFFSITATGK